MAKGCGKGSKAHATVIGCTVHARCGSERGSAQYTASAGSVPHGTVDGAAHADAAGALTDVAHKGI